MICFRLYEHHLQCDYSLSSLGRQCLEGDTFAQCFAQKNVNPIHGHGPH